MILTKNKKFLLSGALLLSLIAFGLYFLKVRNTQTVRPRIAPVVEAVYGLGTVIAPQTYQVKTAVSQSIVEIFTKEGDTVQKGDKLIQLNESGIQRAPFKGTVTAIPFKKGELLFPSVAVLTLVNLENLYLEVSLEQQSILRVKRGQKTMVSIENIRGERINSAVESVFPRDAQFIVRISLEHIPAALLPGMTADVAIEIARKENALTVPLKAVSAGKITLIRDGKKIKETIQIGVIDGEWAEVISNNVLSGDEILVRSE